MPQRVVASARSEVIGTWWVRSRQEVFLRVPRKLRPERGRSTTKAPPLRSLLLALAQYRQIPPGVRTPGCGIASHKNTRVYEYRNCTENRKRFPEQSRNP